MTTDRRGNGAESTDGPPAGPGLLTVVVPCRDRAALLDGCLAALRASLRAGDELIVVDSASESADVATTALRHGARVLRAGWPGTSRARNHGAAAATSEVVAFVDDDVRVDATWATALCDAMSRHPDAAFMTGRIRVPAAQAAFHRPVAVLDAAEPAAFSGAAPRVLGHGANLAVRAEAFAAVDGFDEAFGPGARFRAAEDHVLFDRMLAAGYRGRYEPSMSAEHEQWRQRWALVRLELSYGWGTGARVARLLPSSPSTAAAVAGDALWRDGVRTVPASLIGGHELNAAFVAARIAGAASGFVAAWRATPAISRRQD
jgi:hypothetical protein